MKIVTPMPCLNESMLGQDEHYNQLYKIVDGDKQRYISGSAPKALQQNSMLQNLRRISYYC